MTFASSNCWIHLLAMLAIALASQGITGCVSTNAPNPTKVTAAISSTSGTNTTPVSSSPGTKTTTSRSSEITVQATITAGGVIAKGNGVAVFASIGEPGTPSLQTGSSMIKVSGAGSIAFMGSREDSN